MKKNPALSKSKYSLIMIFLFSISALSQVQQKPIQLYVGKAPGSENWTWTEKETNKNFLNARIVYNVTRPTLTVFLPDPGVANGSSIIICLGGGFHVLLIDYEGSDVA